MVGFRPVGRWFAFATVLVPLSLCMRPAPADDKDHLKAIVSSPHSRAYGRSYGQWSPRWWQWAFSMPIDLHPLYDTADCSTEQSGSALSPPSPISL
jgi:hypothetical protein